MLTIIIIIQLWALSVKGELGTFDYILRLAAYPILYGMYLGTLKFEKWVGSKVNQFPLLITITDLFIEGTVLSNPPLRHKVTLSNGSDIEKAIIEVVLEHNKATPRFHPSQYVTFRIESYNSSLLKIVSRALRKVGVISFTHAENAKNEEDLLIHARHNPYIPMED